jgi:3-oxoacyl-[acyl-carrier-protein] synthase I
MRNTPVAIDITAIGLVSSVGHDALTACAAIRAGVSRPASITGTRAYDLAAAKAAEVVGHPIEPITNGFVGTARWLQMAARAFEDLVQQGRLPPPQDRAFWSTTALQLLVGDLQDERFAFDARSQANRIHESFTAPLLRRLPASFRPDRVLLQPVERVGLALVVEGYRTMLEKLGVERVVVLAVDSYACPYSLGWLGEVGRLKGDLNPTGLMPGEAAAALLLEPARVRPRDQRPAWARIHAVVTAQDSHIDDPDAAPRGRVLGQVLRALLTDDTADLHLDLNGEVWRAREYGNALVELAPRGLGPARLHHCAAEIGDTASAAFVVQAVLATRSLQRGYARGRRVAVACSVESGEIGGLSIGRAEEN